VIAAVEDGSLTLPFVLKKRKDGYDGRGVQIVRKREDLEQAFDVPSIAETLVDIEMELSVIVARNARGEVRSFPPVGMYFHPTANLVEFLFCPSGIGPALEQEAIQIAQAAAVSLGITGLLAVEMFITTDGEILINEVAPRPHNSGHHTIEACNVSQYDAHLRAILNLPLVDTKLKSPSVMVNLLGEPGYSGKTKYAGLAECLRMNDVYVHLYGKSDTKPFRKMGHVTVLSATLDGAKKKAQFVKDTLKVIA
jgi:5-(carboxyamino)imidazole ribonucleotide synthase